MNATKTLKIVSSLAQISGNAIGSIETISEVKLSGGKKNPMQGRVTKTTTGGSVMFFGNSKSNGYANMVNRALCKVSNQVAGKVEEFTPSQRSWGERLKGTPLIKHNNKLYVEFVYLHAPKTNYLLDGKPIEKKDIEGLKPASKKPEHGVVLRTMKIENITALKMGQLSVV